VVGCTMGGLAMRALITQNKSVLAQTNFGNNPKELDGKTIRRKLFSTFVTAKNTSLIGKSSSSTKNFRRGKMKMTH
jgi:hypothetical protein